MATRKKKQEMRPISAHTKTVKTKEGTTIKKVAAGQGLREVATEPEIKNRDARTADLAERLGAESGENDELSGDVLHDIESGLAECDEAGEARAWLEDYLTDSQREAYDNYIYDKADSQFLSSNELTDGVIQYDTSTANDVYEAELMKAFQHTEKSRGIPDDTFDFKAWRFSHDTAHTNSVKCHNEVVERATALGVPQDYAEEEAAERIMLRFRSKDKEREEAMSVMATTAGYERSVEEVSDLVVGEYEIMMGDIELGKS